MKPKMLDCGSFSVHVGKMAHFFQENNYFLCKSQVVTQVLHLIIPFQYILRLNQSGWRCSAVVVLPIEATVLCVYCYKREVSRGRLKHPMPLYPGQPLALGFAHKQPVWLLCQHRGLSWACRVLLNQEGEMQVLLRLCLKAAKCKVAVLRKGSPQTAALQDDVDTGTAC